MNILVIGAGGFIGKHLVEGLQRTEVKVLEHTRKDGDITKEHVLERYRCVDCVYHLAAKTFVPDRWEEPGEFLDNNIKGLINVLEFCRKNAVPLIFLSSYLYGQPMYLPIDEKHTCSAVSPYHLSKKLGEDICKFYSRYYHVDIVVIRPFNVYGPGQREDYLLSKIYRQLMDDTRDTVEVFDLQPKRDFIYISDLVKMLIMLKDKVKGYEVYNIGSGCSYSVAEVIEIMQREFHTNKKLVEIGVRRQNEVMDCVADVTKFNTLVGKIETLSLAEGIHNWHLEVRKKNENTDVEL